MQRVEGIKEAQRALRQMSMAAQGRTVRSALNAALTPGLRAARAAAPVGTRAHRTYLGNLVLPGFLSRNIRKSTRVNRRTGTVTGSIRAAPEAFYGSFLDDGIWFDRAIASAETAMESIYFQKMTSAVERAYNK